MRVNILKSAFSNWISVAAALDTIGVRVKPIDSTEAFEIDRGSVLVIPGVGHMQGLLSELSATGGIYRLTSFIEERDIAVLGICLGFQLMCEFSEENSQEKGLGLFPLEVEKIFDCGRPSVGWFQPKFGVGEQFETVTGGVVSQQLYFTHSYAALSCTGESNGDFDTCYYRTENDRQVVAAVVGDRKIGLQFHPEKSGSAGKRVLDSCIAHLSG